MADDELLVGPKSCNAETLAKIPADKRWLWDDSPTSGCRCGAERYSACTC